MAHPFGLTFGAIGDASTQAAVLNAMLDAAVTMDTPGIRVAPFAWTADDQRARQLRKQRHERIAR